MGVSAIGPGNGPGAGKTAVGRMAARAATAKFSKNFLASSSEFPYSTSSHGGVAQLGERLTGSQEVRGSIPLVSTRALNEAPTQVGAFFISVKYYFARVDFRSQPNTLSG